MFKQTDYKAITERILHRVVGVFQKIQFQNLSCSRQRRIARRGFFQDESGGFAEVKISVYYHTLLK